MRSKGFDSRRLHFLFALGPHPQRLPRLASLAALIPASSRFRCTGIVACDPDRVFTTRLGIVTPLVSSLTPMIERLTPPVSDADLDALAELLVDAVESGAAVSFLAPLTLDRARDWWQNTLTSSHARSIFLVARDTDGLVGTVQLHPAWAPNQPHRGEIVKLLVHRRKRRGGLGTQLMQAIETEARRAGFGLLTLDAKRGEAAERLYRQMGWTHAGTIPRYAFDTNGVTPHDAVILYKELNTAK
jgi:GNAT superfamily N-acetyltransferase